jgi:hypothetical protein
MSQQIHTNGAGSTLNGNGHVFLNKGEKQMADMKTKPATSASVKPKTTISQITQSELEMCFAIHRAANTLAFLLGRKLDQGATVEPGHFTVKGRSVQDVTLDNLRAFYTQGVSIETDRPEPEIFTGA